MKHLNRVTVAIALVMVLNPSPAFGAEDPTFRFLATGDMPYSAKQEKAYRRLLQQSKNEDFAFLMHVGDFKAGTAPCTDEALLNIRDLFRAYPKPVVYSIGDNEWTDCHNSGSDPIERLNRVRELFFHDGQTLRLHQLDAVSQSRDTQFSQFPENYSFSKSGVMFVVVHVVGSGNNLRLDNREAVAEHRQRDAANLTFLHQKFDQAVADDVRGLALVIHANPDFERGSREGFRGFISTLREFLTDYRRPVVCIHGDSHYYRIDKPLKSEAGQTFLHFTRMEVFGSPNVAGVVVSVEPNDPQVFSYRPYYLSDD